MQLKVVICLRVHLYAEGLRRLLEDENDLLVVGMAHNDEEIANVLHCKPDVIITDLSYCGKVLDLQPKNGNRKVLLVNETSDISAERIKEMIDNGLGGILSRDSDSHMLQKAARKLHDGELWLDRQGLQPGLVPQKIQTQGNQGHRQHELRQHAAGSGEAEMTNRRDVADRQGGKADGGGEAGQETGDGKTLQRRFHDLGQGRLASVLFEEFIENMNAV
jgi:DNA-binding NarL/FixJ family response regulator